MKKTRTQKKKYFSDLINSTNKKSGKYRVKSKKRNSRKIENKTKWRSTDNKNKNLNGCFSNYYYMSSPYKGAYDKVKTIINSIISTI